MADLRLGEFIASHRDEIVRRCELKAKEAGSQATPSAALGRGIPLFLDQLVNELGPKPTLATEMRASALQHGRDLFKDGFTIGELVHDYGGVCQAVTDLAVEQGRHIDSGDFRTLNRCLDDAIANAVSEFTAHQHSAGYGETLRVRDLAYMAATTFDILREGRVGNTGATGDLLQRTLRSLRDLVDQSPK